MLLFTPVIVSLIEVPSISVPEIVNVTDELLLPLETVINELMPLPASDCKAPSIEKFPNDPKVSLSTSPSLSAGTEEAPFIVNAVEPVPD